MSKAVLRGASYELIELCISPFNYSKLEVILPPIVADIAYISSDIAFWLSAILPLNETDDVSILSVISFLLLSILPSVTF